MAKNNEQPPKKLSRGRQKVAMVKMANESNLQVTFSKRRTGLFKKASELCTLCGAEMSLIIFSPGKKVFSFGHPSVEVVLDRYAGLINDTAVSGATMQLIEAHRSVSLRDLNTQLAQVMTQVDAERKRGEQMIRQRREAVEAQRWWEAPVDKIETEAQLKQLSRALDDLKRAVSAQTDRIVIETTAAANMANPAPFFAPSGSGASGIGRNSGGQVATYNNNNISNVVPSSSYNNNSNSNNNNNSLGFGRGFY